MQLRSLVSFLTVALMVGLTGCKEDAPARPAAALAAPAPGAVAQTGCLRCHGPFDKLVAASGDYVAPSGEKLSPHRFVPHDSKLEKDIPECTQCHTAHPLSPQPVKGQIDLSKVNVDWCYSCHHEKNFKSCKECHNP